MAVLTVVLVVILGKKLSRQGCHYFDRILLSNDAYQKMYYQLLSVELAPREIGRTFNAALKDIGLDESPYGKRTLYSLRHSFITWELVSQKVTIDVLARQCETSIEMIERHYSHVIPRMFSQHLSGVELPDKKKIEKKWEHQSSVAKLWKNRFLT